MLWKFPQTADVSKLPPHKDLVSLLPRSETFKRITLSFGIIVNVTMVTD